MHYGGFRLCFICEIFCIFVGTEKYFNQNHNVMKKIYLILIAALTVASLALSCKKNNNPTPSNTDTESKDATAEPEASIITIDGDFADWAALKNVAKAEISEDEDAYPCLLEMQAVADETYIYLYFVYQPAEDQASAPIDILFNTDDDVDTGFNTYLFKDAGWDYDLACSDGFLVNGKFKSMNNAMTLYKCDGPDGADRYDEGSKVKNLTAGAKSKGVTADDGIITFELSIKREKMKVEKKGTIYVGVYVSNEEWKENGVLPREDGLASELLEVSLP